MIGMPRQQHTKWTDEERDKAKALFDRGVRPTHAFSWGEFPGRNKQFVWNLFAETRREAAKVCPCGAAREEGSKRCAACLEKVRERLDDLKAQGLCTQCGNPADATLTKCSKCRDLRQKRWSDKQKPSLGLGGSIFGMFRWLASAHPKEITGNLPAGNWKVVEVFGGAGSITLRARQAGYRAVYNDINPLLGNVARVLQEGAVEVLIKELKRLGTLSPDDLLAMYRRAKELPAATQAAVLILVAGNVAHRNMHRKTFAATLKVPSRDWLNRLREHATTLQGVEILTEDFTEVIRQHDGPQTVFVLDPPFPGTHFFEHNLTDERFRELCSLLEGIQGRFLLMSDTSRVSGAGMVQHPHTYWWFTRRGTTTTRQLVSTNYEIDLESVDLTTFGISREPAVLTFQVPRSRDEGIRTPRRTQPILESKPMPSHPTANPTGTSTTPFVGSTLHVVMVPLSSIHPMGGYQGIANQILDQKRVDRYARTWSDVTAGVWILYRTPAGVLLIISGHHRKCSLTYKCEAENINPDHRLIPAHIYTMADVLASGKTEKQFLLDEIQKANDQKEHRFVASLQNQQAGSRWVRGFATYGITASFDPKEVRWGLTYPAVLQAYCTALRAYKALADGEMPTTVLSRLRVGASHDEMFEAYINPDPLLFKTAMNAIVSWVRGAANPLATTGGKKQKHNLYSKRVLTFLFLVYFDVSNSQNRAKALLELPSRFTNPAKPWAGFPKKKNGKGGEPPLVEALPLLLEQANNGRRLSNRLTVLGIEL